MDSTGVRVRGDPGSGEGAEVPAGAGVPRVPHVHAGHAGGGAVRRVGLRVSACSVESALCVFAIPAASHTLSGGLCDVSDDDGARGGGDYLILVGHQIEHE